MATASQPMIRSCPVCDTAAPPAAVIGTLAANHAKLEGRQYDLAMCACGLIYISPAPTAADIFAMYADSPQFDQKQIYRGEQTNKALDFYTERLRSLLSHCGIDPRKVIRLLEIGAGLSWMCRAAKRLNPRSVTIAQDISSEAVPECTWVDHYIVEDLFSCREIDQRGPYDVVSLTHVIEHLVDPVAMLRRIRELTAPAGLVFITAPCRPPGWQPSHGIDPWRTWSYNHVPAHIQYFSRKSMDAAARRAGFDVRLWDAEQEGGQAFEAWLQPRVPKVSMINPKVEQEAAQIRQEFVSAWPFPHVVIDNFFQSDKAEKLLEDFPPFDPRNAKNEFGRLGGKATIADIRKISPFYAEVYDYINSREFLDQVSELTGIPDLVADEKMFGGGTHENLEGQQLDPHVDFNYLEDRKLHRRLNLLLYLNKEWDPSWGGCLEIHSNPRSPDNQIKVIPLAFNRCVIFETSEHSWHGFERIRLPEGKKHLSRKLLSIYLYTHERPAEQIAPPHGTFYVQRPLPKRLVPGYTLTEEDVIEINRGVALRDHWIELYQKKELADSRRIQELTAWAQQLQRALRVPLAGYVLQEGAASGFWGDGWITDKFEVKLRFQEEGHYLSIRGYLPDTFGHDVELCVSKNGLLASRHRVFPGVFTIEVPAHVPAGEALTLLITADKTYNAKRAGVSEDARDLAVLINEIRVVHPLTPAKKAPAASAAPSRR